MFNKKIILILTIILVSLFAISAVSAADNNTSDVVSVEETTDDVLSIEEDSVINQTDNNDMIGVDDGTFTALQNKINTASEGSTITLENDYAYDEGFDKNGIIISKSIIIDGKGKTIDANGQARIFYIEPDVKTTLKNLILKNAYTEGEGGVIYAYNIDLTVTNTIFTNNLARTGGAIYANESNIILSHDKFLKNQAILSGGSIIARRSNVDISNTLFEDSYAGGGGSLQVLSNGKECIGKFESNIFKNSTATYTAGFFYTSIPTTIINCTFENYDDGEYGGVVSENNLNVINSRFKNSHAILGGALGLDSNNDWVVENCTFENCHAQSGGAIYFNGHLTISSSYFVNNSAEYDGGAMYGEYGSGVNCTFINNSASGDGGAIYFEDYDDSVVENSVFVNNSATGSGSAVYLGSGVISSFNDNWWGSNNPDWDELTDNKKPSSYAVLTASTDTITIDLGSKSKLNYAFYRNGTNTLLSLPARPIELSTTGGQLDNTSGYLINEFSTEFSSNTTGNYEITATVDNQEVKLNVAVNKIDTTLTVPDVVVVGNSTGVVFATLKDSYGNVVSGVNVKIVVGSLSKTAKTNKKGRVYLDISGLAPGMYTISARSSATSAIYKESRTTAKAIVSADKIDTTLTVPDVIVLGNSPAGVVATLKDSYGNAVSGVNVKIVVGDLSIIDATDKNGQVSLDISVLEPGEYKISARSSRQTDIYNEARAYAKAIVSADKIDTKLAVPDVVVVGNSTGVVVATLKDSYGNVVSGVNVKIVVGSLSKTAKTNKNGQVSLDISGLAPGVYTISARSSATSAIYKESRTTAKAIVSADKIDTTLTVPDVVVVGNSTGVVVATLKDSYGNVVSGVNVKIVVGSLSKTAKTNKNGQVSLDISPLAPGMYTISARSSATSAIYKESRTTAKAIVSADKIDTKLTVPDVVVVGDSTGVVVATLKDSYGNAVSGVNVKIVVGNLSKTAKTNKNGRVSLDISDLAPGEYKVSARSSATSAIYKESRTTANVIVKGKVASQLTTNNIYINYGDSSSLVVSLKDSNGNAIGNVGITIDFNGKTYTFTTGYNGKVQLPISGLTPNYYTANIYFSGNDFYSNASATSTVCVFKVDTMLTTRSITSNYGADSYLVANLTSSPSGAVGSYTPLIGATVVITINNAQYNLITDSKGQVKFNTKELSPGEYVAQMRYYGDSIYKSSVGQDIDTYGDPTVIINKVNPTITASGVTTNYGVEGFVTATLKDSNGNVMANRLVTFTFEDGTGRTVRTDSKGKAQLSTLGVNAGTHTITVTYAPESGSDDYSKYNSVSSSATMKINKVKAIVYVKDSAGVWIIDKSGNPVKSYYYVNAAVHEDIVVYVENTNGKLLEGVHVRSYPDVLVTNNMGSVTFGFCSWYSGPYELHIDLVGDDNYYIDRLVDNSYYTNQIIVPIWVR